MPRVPRRSMFTEPPMLIGMTASPLRVLGETAPWVGMLTTCQAGSRPHLVQHVAGAAVLHARLDQSHGAQRRRRHRPRQPAHQERVRGGQPAAYRSSNAAAPSAAGAESSSRDEDARE